MRKVVSGFLLLLTRIIYAAHVTATQDGLRSDISQTAEENCLTKLAFILLKNAIIAMSIFSAWYLYTLQSKALELVHGEKKRKRPQKCSINKAALQCALKKLRQKKRLLKHRRRLIRRSRKNLEKKRSHIKNNFSKILRKKYAARRSKANEKFRCHAAAAAKHEQKAKEKAEKRIRKLEEKILKCENLCTMQRPAKIPERPSAAPPKPRAVSRPSSQPHYSFSEKDFEDVKNDPEIQKLESMIKSAKKHLKTSSETKVTCQENLAKRTSVPRKTTQEVKRNMTVQCSKRKLKAKRRLIKRQITGILHKKYSDSQIKLQERLKRQAAAKKRAQAESKEKAELQKIEAKIQKLEEIAAASEIPCRQVPLLARLDDKRTPAKKQTETAKSKPDSARKSIYKFSENDFSDIKDDPDMRKLDDMIKNAKSYLRTSTAVPGTCQDAPVNLKNIPSVRKNVQSPRPAKATRCTKINTAKNRRQIKSNFNGILSKKYSDHLTKSQERSKLQAAAIAAAKHRLKIKTKEKRDAKLRKQKKLAAASTKLLLLKHSLCRRKKPEKKRRQIKANFTGILNKQYSESLTKAKEKLKSQAAAAATKKRRQIEAEEIAEAEKRLFASNTSCKICAVPKKLEENIKSESTNSKNGYRLAEADISDIENDPRIRKLDDMINSAKKYMKIHSSDN